MGNAESGEHCGAKKNSVQAEIKGKKSEVDGTQYANVKNCTSKDVKIQTVTGEVTLPPNKYIQIQPTDPIQQGNVYWWKQGTGLIKK